MKTGTLNLYFRYLSIKKPCCKCVRYKKHGIKNWLQIWVQKPDTGFVTAATSTSQLLVIINNHLNVVHPGRFSSPRFAFERHSLSFCNLWCITNFTIAPFENSNWKLLNIAAKRCKERLRSPIKSRCIVCVFLLLFFFFFYLFITISSYLERH